MVAVPGKMFPRHGVSVIFPRQGYFLAKMFLAKMFLGRDLRTKGFIANDVLIKGVYAKDVLATGFPRQGVSTPRGFPSPSGSSRQGVPRAKGFATQGFLTKGVPHQGVSSPRGSSPYQGLMYPPWGRSTSPWTHHHVQKCPSKRTSCSLAIVGTSSGSMMA
jgi:hypothetical protein